MNRSLVPLLSAAAFLLLASPDVAPAQGLPISTLSVKILSVDREALDRRIYHRQDFQSGESSGGWSEKTSFVARAQIQSVLNSDHGLSLGAIIDIRYIVVQSSVPAEVSDRTLKTGETVTLTLFERAKSFWWRRQQ